MANLRIIADNAAIRATLTASSTAGALAATHLQTSKKSEVWRAAGSTARLTLAWPSAETIAGVALPFCNFSPAASMRVRLTREPPATNLLSYSESFADASWEKIATNVSATAGAPDGSMNASVMSATGTDPYVDKTVTLAPGAYTFSVFLKGVGGTVGKAPNVWIWNIGNVAGFSAAADTRPLTNGWVRYVAICTVGTAGTYRVRVDVPEVAVVGDLVHAWGAQMERGALSSYYPTGAAAATRPPGHIDGWQSYDYDSGALPACPAPAIRLPGWTPARAASAYAYGGGACARHWLPAAVPALGMAIDIADPDNLQGALEAACLVAGPVWSPVYNAASASATDVDGTTHYRTGAGDLVSRASTIHRKVPIDLQYMPPRDRAALADILRGSRAHPLFLSVFPGHPDLGLERDHTVYGKRMSDSEVAVQTAIRYGTKIEVESI